MSSSLSVCCPVEESLLSSDRHTFVHIIGWISRAKCTVFGHECLGVKLGEGKLSTGAQIVHRVFNPFTHDSKPRYHDPSVCPFNQLPVYLSIHSSVLRVDTTCDPAVDPDNENRFTIPSSTTYQHEGVFKNANRMPSNRFLEEL